MIQVKKGFSESTIASAKTIIEDAIDAAFEIGVGFYKPTTLKVDLMLDIMASRSAGGTRKFDFQTTLHAYHASTSSTIMKDNLTPVFTEWEDTITSSGRYNSVDSVVGSITIRPDDLELVLGDPTAIISSTKDGYIWSGYKANWADAYGATTGQSVDDSATNRGDAIHATYTGTQYTISRAFFYFDLSGVAAGTIAAARIDIDGNGENDSDVMLQRGTQAATLTTADIDSFSGASLGNVDSWLNTAINEITLDSAGLVYLQSVLDISGTALICAREYTHDFLNESPFVDGYGANGCWFADAAQAVDRPTLYLWIA